MAEYEKMRAEGCRLDGHVFSALIAALGGAVCGPDADRRMQLVLLERAFQLLDDMKVRVNGIWGSEIHDGVMHWTQLMCEPRKKARLKTLNAWDLGPLGGRGSAH
jgi:hypothetical protein